MVCSIWYFVNDCFIHVEEGPFIGKLSGPNLDHYFQLHCYETIMFGGVTYARRRCKARAFSVYITHILLSKGSCSLRLNERIHLYPFFCVSFTRVICYDQLTLISYCNRDPNDKWSKPVRSMPNLQSCKSPSVCSPILWAKQGSLSISIYLVQRLLTGHVNDCLNT